MSKQASNAELIAAMDEEITNLRETCHETIIDHNWTGCSSCGYVWDFMYVIGKCERPRYCPNCGCKVVDQ